MLDVHQESARIVPASWADVEPALRSRAFRKRLERALREGQCTDRMLAEGMFCAAASTASSAAAPAPFNPLTALPLLKLYLDADTDTHTATGTAKSGTGDSISTSGQTLTDAGQNFNSPTGVSINNALWIGGASNSANNGVFRASTGSAASCTYANSAAVNETSSFGWELMGQLDAATDQVGGYAFTLNGTIATGWACPIDTKTYAPHKYILNLANQACLLRNDATLAGNWNGNVASYGFVWGRPKDVAANQTYRFLAISNGFSGATNCLFLEVIRSSSNTSVRLVHNATAGNTNYSSGTIVGLSITAPFLFGWNYDGAGNATLWVNGAQVAAPTGTARAPSGLNYIQIPTANTNGPTMTGVVGAGAGAQLTASQWAALYSYLAAKKA